MKKPPVNRCARCKHDFTVTSGTLFADTHKPLRLWFEAIWDISNQKSGASALGLQRVLGLGELSNRVELAPQATQGNGAAWERSFERSG